jgi:hypothetical protein
MNSLNSLEHISGTTFEEVFSEVDLYLSGDGAMYNMYEAESRVSALKFATLDRVSWQCLFFLFYIFSFLMFRTSYILKSSVCTV